jgi:hypothetical protein
MNKILCNCGHYENERDIHVVANPQQTDTVDLCEECWHKEDLDQIYDGKLCTYQFAAEEDFLQFKSFKTN